MGANVDLDLVLKVVEKTIGYELATQTISLDSEIKRLKELILSSKRFLSDDIYKTVEFSENDSIEQLRILAQKAKDLIPIKDDEYVSDYCIPLDDDGKYIYIVNKKPLLIDKNKNIDNYLSDEDKEILRKEGFFGDDAKYSNIEIGISDRDDNILIMRTCQRSWMKLCGREWHYNIKDKKVILYSMN